MGYYLEIFAGDSFSYSSNVALDNTVTWTANAWLRTLDFSPIIDGNNVEVGILTANLNPISTNTPNSVNYTLTLSANVYATGVWIANSISTSERKLYLFTKYSSNTGISQHGNVVILIVKSTENYF
jgi:hypothetical protein